MADTDDLLRVVAEGTARHLGQEFLLAMVRALHDAMEVSLALVTQGVGTPISRARPLHFWRSGWDGEVVEYDLSETGCARVYGGEEVIVPADVCVRYPKEHDFQGYVGMPMRSPDGQVFGNLAVFSVTPLKNPDVCANVIRIFARRAEAEILRRDADAERERLIAALTRVNERLDRQVLNARRANAVKSQLLGMAAHDLRGPIGAIISRAETAETYIERTDPASLERAKACCEEAIKSAERVEAMIRRLLDAARQDREDLPFALRRINLIETARAALALSADAAKAKDITTTIIAPDQPIVIEADEELLLEAIDNLVSNAIKYSSPGGAVEISVEAKSGEARVSISDRGQGLSPDDLQRAFGRFQRLSAKPTGGEESVGLGLSIVRAIAERHGGTALAESDGRGKGARFSLVLPIGVDVSGKPPVP